MATAISWTAEELFARARMSRDTFLSTKIWPYIRKDERGCWLWQGNIGAWGYGNLFIKRKPYRAHRVVLTLAHGPIPDGLVPDHLCRIKHCVNPNHLELVTHRENSRRGIHPRPAVADKRKALTHCKRGHPFSEANTHYQIDRRGSWHRRCQVCHRIAERKRRYVTKQV